VGEKYATRIEQLALSLYKAVCYVDIGVSECMLIDHCRREITPSNVALS